MSQTNNQEIAPQTAGLEAEPTVKEEPAPPTLSEIPEMTEAYHKARRSFSLFSAILIAWEYVGIRVGGQIAKPTSEAISMIARSSGTSNLNTPVTSEFPGLKTPVTIEHPEVIPIVILTLVLYFGTRFTLEWFQSDSRRRDKIPSKVDFYLNLILGIVAIGFFGFQQITEYRLADILTPRLFLWGLLGVGFTSIIFNLLFYNLRKTVRNMYKSENEIFIYKRSIGITILITVVILVIFDFILYLFLPRERIEVIFVACVVALFIHAPIHLLFYIKLKKKNQGHNILRA